MFKRFCILLFLTSCLSWGSWSFYAHLRRQSPDYTLRALLQAESQKAKLSNAHLAEILDLSMDDPPNLYALDLRALQEKLEASPLISSARVKRYGREALLIHYDLHKALFFLEDISGAALTKEALLIPYRHFFPLQKRVFLTLGINESLAPVWGKPLSHPFFSIAVEILSLLEDKRWPSGVLLKRIDLSALSSASIAGREVLCHFVDEKGWELSLRLDPKRLAWGLAQYIAVRELSPELWGGDYLLLDLREDKIAFIRRDPRYKKKASPKEKCP